MSFYKRIIGITTAAVLLCGVISPAAAAADGAVPDGNHTLSEIFPGGQYNSLAEQIGYYIDQPVTYKPVSEGDFDDITAVSCPSSHIPGLEGLQYCRNIEDLYLADNEIGSNGMALLPQLSPSLAALNLSGNGIDSSGLKYLQGLTIDTLMLADNNIGDNGLENLPNTLIDLDLSNNGIGDAGAGKINQLTNLDSLDLSKNNIGIDGMKLLASRGFISLKMDGQTVTLPSITSGRVPIIISPPGGVQYIVQSGISNGGKIDRAKGGIVWPPQSKNAALSYKYSYSGYSGTAFVPFKYSPFMYTVTFDGQNGHITKTTVKDLDKVPTPAEPVREGYMFMGWSKTKDGTVPFDFSTPIERSINLYARWGLPKPSVYYKSIGGVHVTVNDANANVMWEKVKSANGYFVYKYSKEKKKYLKAATLQGRSKHIWVDREVKDGSTYMYKVQPYTIDNGKKKKMKRSYPVSTIINSNKYGNALKAEVTPSKTIKSTLGKTVKLKAKVYGEPDKKLVSSKVRWISSNKNIATVSKSGKVKLKKKGTCYIWAKAHNGINSKKVKIVVK